MIISCVSPGRPSSHELRVFRDEAAGWEAPGPYQHRLGASCGIPVLSRSPRPRGPSRVGVRACGGSSPASRWRPRDGRLLLGPVSYRMASPYVQLDVRRAGRSRWPDPSRSLPGRGAQPSARAWSRYYVASGTACCAPSRIGRRCLNSIRTGSGSGGFLVGSRYPSLPTRSSRHRRAFPAGADHENASARARGRGQSPGARIYGTRWELHPLAGPPARP